MKEQYILRAKYNLNCDVEMIRIKIVLNLVLLEWLKVLCNWLNRIQEKN